MAITEQSIVRVKAIDHVTIVTKDLEKSEHFYQHVLGMEPIDRPNFGFPGTWFQAGSTQIHITLESPQTGTAGLPRCNGTDAARGFHFAFEIDDCDQAAVLLREAGIEIAVGPKSRPDGPRQLYIYDPDDHLVELYSR